MRTMMNVLAVCVIVSSVVAAGFWSPTPTTQTQNRPSDEEQDGTKVIVREGHRVVVVEYDENGHHNTKVSISPHEDHYHVHSTSDDAKGRTSDFDSPDDVVVADEHGGSARGRGPGELICDAYGKCKQKIVNAFGKATDTVSDQDRAYDLKEAAKEGAYHAKDRSYDQATEAVKDGAYNVQDSMGNAIHKVKDRAYDAKEATKRGAYDAKEAAKDQAYKVRDAVGSVIHKAKDGAYDAKEAVKEEAYDAKEAAKDGAYKVNEAAKDQAYKVSDAVGNAIHKAKDRAYGAKEATKDRAYDAKDATKDRAYDAKEAAKEGAYKVRDAVGNAVHKAKAKVDDANEVSKDRAYDAEEAAIKGAYKVGDAVGNAVRKAKDKVYGANEAAKDQAYEAKEAAGKVVFRAKSRAQSANEAVKDRAHGANLLLNHLTSIVGLLGFTTALGTCVWVSFVSSYVLARAMGRNQFGMVQSKVYPVYFKVMACCIGAALAGHLLRHRKRLSNPAEGYQAYNLSASLLIALANLFLIEPRATKVMLERMKIEKEEGRGIGESQTSSMSRAVESGPVTAVPAERTGDDIYRGRVDELNSKLKRYNSFSSVLNLLTLVGLTWHLVYLSQLIQNCLP